MSRRGKSRGPSSQRVVDPLDVAAAAAAPLRAWFADGCGGPEPAPGLSAALARGTDSPFVLTGDELEYFGQLFGDRSPFDVPGRDGESRARTTIRDSLLDRGFVVSDRSKRGAYAVALAPEYLATIGVAYLAPRSMTAQVLAHDRQDYSVVVHNSTNAVLLELCEDDQVRFRAMTPDEGFRELVGGLRLEFPGDAGETIEVSDEEYSRYIELGTQAGAEAVPALAPLSDGDLGPNWSSMYLTDHVARPPAWWARMHSVNVSVRGSATWLIDRWTVPERVRVRRVNADEVNAILEEYWGDPGPASERLAREDARAAAEAIAARKWWQRAPWLQVGRALRTGFKTLGWICTVIDIPTSASNGPAPWRAEAPTPAPPAPPPPVRGLTPNS